MKKRFFSLSRHAVCALLVFFGLLASVPAHAAPWLPFGPDGGDARRFAADPHDRTHLYLGTVNGWLYESHDTGASWKRLSLVGKRDDLILDSIVVDPSDPKHIVIGAYSVDKLDGGLFITYDGGSSWISQAEMRGQSIRSLAIAPSDPQVWVAGTLKGVYRSTDGARRWKLISPPGSTEIHEVESIAIDPQDSSVIYAGTWHLPWKTTDAGANWESIKNGIIDDSDVFSIIIDPVKPSVIYASACSGIYKSLDAGAVFVKIEGIPTTARRTRVLLQDPSRLSTVFAGTTEGLFRSEDAGKTWTRTTGPDIIVNDVLVSPDNASHVLIATDRGGVLASDDGGDTFRSSNAGFSARQVTSLLGDRQHPATLFTGVVNDKEWGGVFESENGGLSWTQRSDGLNGRDVFSLGQAPDGTILAGTAHGLFRLDRQAQSWFRIDDLPRPSVNEAIAATEIPPAVVTRAPVAISRNQFAKAKAARAGRAAPRAVKGKAPLKKTASQSGRKPVPLKRPVAGRSLAAHGKATPRSTAALPSQTTAATRLPAPSFDGSIFSLAVSADTLLATTTEGLIQSKDNGASWQMAGPPGTQDWRLLSAAGNQAVAATLSAAFTSSDSGTTWTKLSLPDTLTRVEAVAVEPSGEVWVGGREGVFVSADGGASWSTPKNLFLSLVNSIYYDESANRILVTCAAPSELVFSVQLPAKTVTYTNIGWVVRFVRPVGDHMVAVTPFDGIVIQPKMMPSPVRTASPVQRQGD